MNYQAKITPNGPEGWKQVPIEPGRPVSATIHPNDQSVLIAPPQNTNSAPTEAAKPVVEGPLKVAVIGTAPSSRMMAPFSDPTWKIWACSPGNQGTLPRWDEWYEIHANLLWPECVSYGGPYIEWLKQQTLPVYMQNNNMVPNALTFPKDALLKEFGPYFFTSSFAWMMAFAIIRGAKEIALFGVDMASKDEYILQRPGGYYFMQEAAKRGIKVSVPVESDLCQPPPLYGYSEITPMGRKLHVRDQELVQRIRELDNQIAQATHNRTYLQGAREDLDYMKSIWGGAQSF